MSPSVDGRTKSLSFQVTVTDYGGLQDSDEALVTVEGDSEEWYSEFGCFIATAAYGSALSNEVDVFKQFRDQYLLTNEFGRAFVSVYYRYSPTLAGYIAKHPMIRKIVRIGLYPVLRLSKWFVDENPSR
ncbi:MAG: hypothetical protein GTO23_00075 [Nitrososphaeria archaeon]|nr:hypothetical protein [Nitrososphaeria archaeon]